MKTLLLAASIAALGIASPVLTQPDTVPARAAVSTAGLDLATAAGRQALDLRILHAASALCGTPSAADRAGRAAFETCRADAIASAAGASTRLAIAAR